MPRRPSLEAIRRKISELQAKARELEQKPGLAEVLKLMRKNKIELSDIKSALGSSDGSPRKGVRAQKKTSPRKVSTKSSKSIKGKKVPVKYRDQSGNSWSGRGMTPKWLKEAEKNGRKREQFLV